jgi:hypothetical protein
VTLVSLATNENQSFIAKGVFCIKSQDDPKSLVIWRKQPFLPKTECEDAVGLGARSLCSLQFSFEALIRNLYEALLQEADQRCA